MSEFVEAVKVNEIPDPGKQLLEIDNRLVVLFHVGGQFYCLDDVCTHDDGPLGEGKLTDFTVACPRHGAKFDIRDGRALTMPATEPTVAHEVKVEGQSVFIRINED